ncbi:MAG: HIT family protein [Candidatus Zixiibacteriota bacterium]|nr:MAG: HIT family protein [candidate division Zixibacteria bacterium]
MKTCPEGKTGRKNPAIAVAVTGPADYNKTMSSVFTRIINRELPARVFYETEQVIVIADHRPKAPVHLLIIPKAETRDFYRTPAETLSLLDETVKVVARKLGVEDRFRVIINNGLGQEIDHIHYHFLSDSGAARLEFLPEK